MRDTVRVRAPGVRMIAHRGLSGIEKENTCAAFVAAGNRSYYGVETDIHRTSDGRLIVFHDDNLQRIAGVDLTVEETDFDTLRAVRMADRDGVPRHDLVLPSLEEYVSVCKTYGKESILELKNPFAPEDIDRVIALLRSLDWLEHTVFISFDLGNLLHIRRRLPQQRAQFLVCEFSEGLIDLLRENRLDLDIHYATIDAAQIRACHDAGIEVNVWTVDSPEDAQRLCAWGVDYITSNILEASAPL